MKVAIYFASKHGQTRKIAKFLEVQLHELGFDVTSIDLNTPPISLRSADQRNSTWCW
jgi:menaquinone-dependent protoporphyrinogen IX oxidase